MTEFLAIAFIIAVVIGSFMLNPVLGVASIIYFLFELTRG